MSLPYKLDPEMAKLLRSYLDKLDIKKHRVIIDLENDTVEPEEEYSIDDILESAGILTKKQAEELLKDVESSRKEWD